MASHQEHLPQAASQHAGHHPGGWADVLLGQRGEDDGQAVPGKHRPHEGAEDGQARIGVGGVGEEVAGGQDNGHELQAVDEPVGAHDPQGERRGASGQQVPDGVGQVADRTRGTGACGARSTRGTEPPGSALRLAPPLGPAGLGPGSLGPALGGPRPGEPVGAQLVAAQATHDPGGSDVEPRGGQEAGDVLGVRWQREPQEEAGDRPGGRGRPTEGRHQGVRGQEPVGVHHVGQARGEGGQEEAVDPQGREDQEVDHHPGARAPYDHGRGEDEPGAHEVHGHEGAASSEAVNEGTGEGADHAEGQEHDDQGGGDVARARGVLGSEEEEGDQAHLDHAVTGLGDEAGGQEDPQAARGGQIPQVVSQSHAPRLRAQGSRSRTLLA